MKLDLDNYSMQTKEDIKMKGPFLHRDLSWIQFNIRVLLTSNRKDVPFNEKLKFLAISDSNMNEFLGVRFSDVYKNRDTEPYKELLSNVIIMKQLQNKQFKKLMMDMLDNHKIKLTKVASLSKEAKGEIFEDYMANIFPLLTPINEDSIEDSTLQSGQLAIVCSIKDGDNDVITIVPIDDNINPLYMKGNKLFLIEDVIQSFLKESLFINKEITYTGTFSITKDASMILSHDTNRFIIDRMQETLRKRYMSKPIFIDVIKDMPQDVIEKLFHIFNVPNHHMYRNNTIIGYKRFMKPVIKDDNCNYKKFEPFVYENHENYYSLFDVLKEKDILLHHPYDSYDTVIKFIEHASIDKDVVAIKQTLYRVSSIDSPIVNALCEAAKNGKKVTVLIEIKARFDEMNNIHLIDKLRNAGATVLLGLEYLKTHCKMCIVIRKEDDKLKTYCHVASGNYNEKTARLYTDLSYFTSKTKIGTDLLHVFNILSGHSKPDEKLDKINYAPVTLRKKIIKCIDREIDNAKKGKKAEIFMKMNALSDKIMVNKLYEAADKGVKIYIICRGACSLYPRKNITIKSIVGRFLEHSRIYYFYNDKNPDYFISSADLLTRNLDKRVEILLSLKDSNVIKQLKWMIKVYKEDTVNSQILNTVEYNKYPIWLPVKTDKPFDSHQWFIEYSDIKKAKKSWRK